MTTKQKLDLAFASYNTLFNRGIANAKTFYERVAMTVHSTGSEENYVWLQDFPNMREWIGERAVKELEESGYSIKNKDFEMTVKVPRKTIEDDKQGIYGPSMERMGEAAQQWPDSEVFPLLYEGFKRVCYDGVSFFNSAHPVGANTVSNTSKKPLSVDSYKEARALMMSLTSDSGNPLNIIPDLLVVPPQLEEAARRILKSDHITIGGVTETNPWKDSADYLVVPRLAAHPKKWFLLQTDGVLRPLIWQLRKEPDFQAITSPEAETVFNTNNYLFGSYGRGNSGYGFWQQAFGSTGE